MPEDAATVRVGKLNALEIRTRDVGNPVVPRQTAVDERVVGRQQLQHAAIGVDDVIEEQLGFALHRVGQRRVVTGIRQRVGMDLVEILQPQPLRGEARRQRLRSRIGKHPANLLVEDRGRPERAETRDVQQLRVRRGGPQEIRQARRQLEVTDAVVPAGPRRCGRRLEPEDEIWARENRLQRHADARLEIAVLAPRLVELQQALEIAAGRPAVGLGRQRRQDLPGAWKLFTGRHRPAGEDPPPARRLGHAGDSVRSGDRQIPQVRQDRDADGAADLRVGQRVLDRRQQIVDRSVEAREEGRRDALRSGFHRDRRRLNVHPVRIGLAHPRVDVEQCGARAVDRHLDLLPSRRAAVELSGRDRVQHHPEDVLAVGRERVHDGDAAARAERRALDVMELVGGARHLVGRLARRRRAVADREVADLRRRAQVPFEHRRGEGLHVGDVVEVVAHGVGGEERFDVDVDFQQVVHRTAVFSAIQPLERTPARIRLLGGHFVDPQFKRCRERFDRGGVGAARGGRRRHHPRAELADHFFRELGVLIDAARIEVLEREAAGFRLVVVATRAVFVDQTILRVYRHRRRGRPRRRRRARGRGRADARSGACRLRGRGNPGARAGGVGREAQAKAQEHGAGRRH